MRSLPSPPGPLTSPVAPLPQKHIPMPKINLPGLRALAAAALCLCLGSAHAQDAAPAEGPALDSLIREAMLYAYPYQEFMKMRHEALEVKDSATATTLNHFRHARHLARSTDACLRLLP